LATKPGVQDPIIKEFNPEQSDAKLDCSQYVNANPPLSTFTWSYSGVLSLDKPNELTLIPQTDGVTETASCTAENGLCMCFNRKYLSCVVSYCLSCNNFTTFLQVDDNYQWFIIILKACTSTSL